MIGQVCLNATSYHSKYDQFGCETYPDESPIKFVTMWEYFSIDNVVIAEESMYTTLIQLAFSLSFRS
jgi:hypothetical protein